MKSLYSAGSRYSLIVLAIIVAGLVVSGQGMGKPNVRTGYPTDWSHHDLIFSAPKDAAQAVELSKDPRYLQQWYRRNAAPSVAGGGNGEGAIGGSSFAGWEGDRSGRGRASSNPLHSDWNESLGLSGTVGAGHYPAKYSFSITTTNCGSSDTPDYVVFNTSLVSSASQASIVAFDNLYTDCGGFVPTVYWAFDTGGNANTSPVLSEDGTQIAFTQKDNGTGSADLVILRWATGGTVASPKTPMSEAAGSYLGCTAPCMTVIALADGNTDTNSSPFYDYAHDTVYVGDDGGILHKITGVFSGLPTEVSTGGWPAATGGIGLTNPVADFASGNVFVGGANAVLYSVAESSGAVTASGTLGAGLGIVASPIVNSTLGHVYAFLGQDNKTTTCLGGSSAYPCNGVYEFSTTAFTSGGMGSEVVLGPSENGTYPLYAGDFDNAFYTSSNGTGSMYVCGQDNASNAEAAMYLVTISTGVATSAIGGTADQLTNASSACSPVTEFYNPNLNGGTDQIFWSVVANGLGAYCAAAGCVNNATITPWQANHAYAVGNFVLDTNYVMEVVMTAGTSGASTPSWPTPGALGAPSATTTDGTVTWISQGFPTARHGSSWTGGGHTYTVGTTLWISSNNSYQYATVNGTSGGPTPTFSATPGVTTTDNTEIWISLGVPSSYSFETTGGASGIIIDNAVTSLGGASQLYFSNLTPGSPSTVTCTAGNGCAVQVSQSALK